MSKLLGALEREVLLVSQFIELLNAEKAELSSGKAENLDSINAKKLVLVESLNAAGSERARLIG